MEFITIGDITYTVERRETKVGDTVFARDSNTTYVATINDADDINFIVVDTAVTVNTAVRHPSATQVVESLEACIEALHRGREISWYARQLLTKLADTAKTEIAMIP